MLYKIRSKETLKVLYDFFSERGFDVVDPTVETELEVEVTEENQADFETLVSVYIAYTLFVRATKAKLETSIIEDATKYRFMDEAVRYFNQSPYWKGLTLVLVSSYFERSNSINIESFMLFNMKGFKAEIEKYVDAMLAMPEEGEEDEGQEIEEVSVQELYKEIRKKVEQMDFDFSIFKTVHLRQKGDALVFTAANGTILDEQFFMYHLGSVLQLEVRGAIVQWEKDIMLLPSICMIFPVEEVVVHEVEDAVKEAIQFARSIISPDLTSVTFTDCNGCEDCNE